MPAVLRVGRGFSYLRLRPDPYIAWMHGCEVKNIQAAIIAPAPHNIVIERVGLRIATFASADTMPCSQRDATATEITAWPAIAPGILPVSINIIRHAIIHRHVIHLRDGQIDILPCLSFIESH